MAGPETRARRGTCRRHGSTPGLLWLPLWVAAVGVATDGERLDPLRTGVRSVTTSSKQRPGVRSPALASGPRAACGGVGLGRLRWVVGARGRGLSRGSVVRVRWSRWSRAVVVCSGRSSLRFRWPHFQRGATQLTRAEIMHHIISRARDPADCVQATHDSLHAAARSLLSPPNVPLWLQPILQICGRAYLDRATLILKLGLLPNEPRRPIH